MSLFAGFYLSLFADNSYLFVSGKEIFKFKADNKNVNFLTQFCLGSISNRFSVTESLNGDVNDFSVNYNSIDKSDILNIRKYWTKKYIYKSKFSLFIILLSFSSFLARDSTKCLLLNYERCMIRPTLINMNPVKLKYYPFFLNFKKVCLKL